MKLEDIKKKIQEKSSREARSSGNPNEGDINRELSERGRERQAEDIPKQDSSKWYRTQASNVAGNFQSSTVITGGQYKIGPPTRPNIHHDAGFSKFPKRDATLSDYLALYKWKLMMDGAAALRSDLSDAVAAYGHFLSGEGKNREFSYDRYVNTDSSGRLTLRNSILDAQDAAIKLWRANGEPEIFNFTGPSIPCGSFQATHSYLSGAFPYPATENWQKAIGAHTIWLSGIVKVKKSTGLTVPPVFTMKFSLHGEDQYNFNPGMKDIASGIPDDENGQFVVCGLARGYRHTSTLERSFSWKGFDLGVATMGINLNRIPGKPQRAR